MFDIKRKATPEMKELLRATASDNRRQALDAQHELAKALELPLRKGMLSGDIHSNIFESMETNAQSVEWPLDLLTPGTEKDHVAYTLPNHGHVPERNVESTFVTIPTYQIGNAVDWLLKYARDARWDVVARAMEVMEEGFTKKLNDDAWHTILSAGVDRNIVVVDSDAAAGQFTKRLVSLMKLVMRRNAGGNSSTMNRGRLTDLYMSPEGVEDIRNWGVDQVDETTRREIFVAADGSINRIFSVNLHDIDELGENKEYQNFYTNTLGGSFSGSDVELVVGLDLSKNDSFVMPVLEELQIFEDEVLHRKQRAGFYGWMSMGFAVLDGRRCLLGGF